MDRVKVFILCAFSALAIFADVRFAPLFGDGAVLQCEMNVNVWGTAEPGESVAVSFADQCKQAVADEQGSWMVQLDPMPPSMMPRTLAVVSHVSGFKSQVSNILVGEVWLATGQSNMVMPLQDTEHGPNRLARTIPEIRFVKVPHAAGLPVKTHFAAEDLKWNPFEPGPSSEIAAVAFYFAEKLQAETGRQIGIIQSSFGGTPCQAWTPEWALDAHPELKYYADAVRKALASGKTEQEWIDDANALSKWSVELKQWQKTKKGAPPKNPGPQDLGNLVDRKTATTLYENMIKPLVPYTARGVVWYQGEANAWQTRQTDEYRVLFPAMIDAWRTVWNRPDWPFYFVQLAAYDDGRVKAWADMRAVQTFVRDSVENTGMALAIDCGNKTNVHPHRKQPVGERLARLALADVYGQHIAARGPAVQSIEVVGGKLRIVFQWSENGLRTSDGSVSVPGFEVAGLDGAFGPAEARIVSADAVELDGFGGNEPIDVRYGWANFPEPPLILQNSEGLPAEPFSCHLP